MTLRFDRSTLASLALPLTAAMALSAAGCKPSGNAGGDSADNAILVGHYASMTGDTATFGTETDNGVRLAMKQLNAAGGVLGKQISVDTQDDRSLPDEAKTVATAFAANPKIVAVLGEVASTRSLNAAPVLQRAGIPMVSPSSTNPDVTKVGDYIFRVCFIDPFQGFVMAKFAHDNLKVGKVAVMRDQGSDYSVGLANVFKEEFQKMGGTIIADVSYNSKDSNFRSQLAQLKDAQAIFIPGYYGEVGTIARQARELGITAPLMGGDGWDSDKLIEGAGGPGKALEGCYFSNHYSKDDKSPRVQTFETAYEKEYSKPSSGLSAMGYDAMEVLADAIKRANSTDHSKVRDALAATKDYPGVTGNITIDANRNATKPAVVLQIKGSQFAYVTTIAPPVVAGAPAK
jgi:branched-chain amino acid transport system substrate-binding protein